MGNQAGIDFRSRELERNSELEERGTVVSILKCKPQNFPPFLSQMQMRCAFVRLLVCDCEAPFSEVLTLSEAFQVLEKWIKKAI